MNERVADS